MPIRPMFLRCSSRVFEEAEEARSEKLEARREQPLLREFCFYNVFSAFPVPEPNDVVILSSPVKKITGQEKTVTRDVSKDASYLFSRFHIHRDLTHRLRRQWQIAKS